MSSAPFPPVMDAYLIPDKPPIYIQAPNEAGLYWQDGALHLGEPATDKPGSMPEPFIFQLIENQLHFQRGTGPYKTSLQLSAEEVDSFLLPSDGQE